MKEILKVENLKTYFYLFEGVIKAVDGISFSVKEGEILGIVGESGSGKTVTASSILRLIPCPPGKIISGKVLFNDIDLLKVSNERIRQVRGNEISMIFQDPMTSLDPVFSVGSQIMEPLLIHKGFSKKKARSKAIDLLSDVDIPNPKYSINDYPHKFSGGMRQRIMIAMALACSPKILIADEPTTALDVTIQAQIFRLMNRLRKQYNSSIIIITHDLGVIAKLAESVIVMYGGTMVEYGSTESIFYDPLHPYTWGLLNSIPKITKERLKLHSIKGNPISLLNVPKGCNFNTRCEYAMDICYKQTPMIKDYKSNHKCACFLTQSQMQSYRNERILNNKKT